jgi:ankyrin repeat protein
VIFFKDGRTALIIASEYGHFEIVKFFIENDADVNIQTKVN